MRRGADAFGSRDGHSQALDLAPAQGGFVEMQFVSLAYTFVNPPSRRWSAVPLADRDPDCH